jgi:phosphoserine phosphatase
MEYSRKVIIFDMDKTLIQGNSWYKLNIAMGIRPDEDEILYRLGPEKEGVLSYEQWLHILAKLIVKRSHPTREDIEKVVLSYKFVDGAQKTVKALKERGYTIAIISGSFNLLVDDVSRKLGIEHGYNNTYLVFDDQDMFEDVILTWDDAKYKPLLVQSICRRFGLHPKDIYYVADGDNDLEIFRETIGVAVNGPLDQDEEWKQKAKNAGEEFSQDYARNEAKHRIDRLDQLLSIVP